MAQITLRDYLQQTEDAISSSRVDDALTRCQFMLSYFPQALEIQRLLGEVYLAQGRMEEAQHLLDWVLTNDPENVLAYCNRAHLSELMSEYDVALDCYQQAYELSRGNGQIREEFNRLSEKTGQKGFMFSRAGLARLYMRGDMLSEATQEWETVLAATPDRLDARIGLLETYWQAGHTESVEQLAEQILHDVPACLKALLLQASATSAKDSRRSQELLRRAEALDPDLIAAQVLFADALASQPDDPFLRLLRKAPAHLPDPKPQQAQEQRQNAFALASDPINASVGAGLGQGAGSGQGMGSTQGTGSAQGTIPTVPAHNNVMDALAMWGKDAYGDNDTTLVKPRSDTAFVPSEMGVTPLWGQSGVHDNSSSPGISLPLANQTTQQAPQSAPIQEMNTTQSAQQMHTGSQEHSPEPWELLQDALNQFDTMGAEPRMTMGSPTAPYKEDVPSWQNVPDADELSQPALDLSASAPSPTPKQEESISLSGMKLDPWGVPMEEPGTEKPLPSITIGASATTIENPESQPSWLKTANEEKAEEDEESFFGPSWLKSLGATTMAEEEAPASSASASEAQTPDIAQPERADLQHEQYAPTSFAQHSGALMQVPPAPYPSEPAYNSVPETNPYESWSQASANSAPNINDLTSWISTGIVQELENTNYGAESSQEDAYAPGTHLPQSSADLPAEQPAQWETAPERAEQNLMTTLEELEQSLWSKGFIPLEPNSLATLAAQTQESSVPSHDLATWSAPEGHDAPDFQPSVARQEPQETHEDPSLSSALAQLGSIAKESPSPTAPSLASPSEVVEQNEEPSWLQALKNVSAAPVVPATPTWPDTSLESSAPAAQAVHVPQPPPAEVEPIVANSHDLTQPAARELQQTVKAPAMRGNPLLEGELETTMRRPAVRLQSMQHHTSPLQRKQAAPTAARSSRERIEQASKVTKPANENLSYRERLVKGYQHQLVGDYDEAMQQYRLIIRSGTDLLNEVISNVRALLKLAPNYSAGHRVLGDAYMRQGEYLQAMEAYNKALTATKKVKSRT